MKQKHILVVSQYFYPEQFRVNDLCSQWVKRGYRVTVLTGIPNYPQGKFYPGYGLCKKRRETFKGGEMIRIPLIPRGSHGIGLICNYLSFVVSGFFWQLFTRQNADLVFNYEVSPMTQALVGVWYARKRGIPCFLYVTDLWPDNVAIVTGIRNRAFLGAIGRMVDYIYKNSERIFTSSRSFRRKIIRRGAAKEKVIFWPQYAEDFYRPMDAAEHAMQGEESANGQALAQAEENRARSIQEPMLQQARVQTTAEQKEAFRITFAGNIGYAQGLQVLIHTARRLKEAQALVQFHIVGDGRYKEELIAGVKKAGVEAYFQFTGQRKPQEIPEILAKSDAVLITLDKSEVFAMTIPAKTQSCMACGKPILAAADGEIGQIIKKAGCGFACGAQDAKALAEQILAMSALSGEELEALGRNARRYYEENFDCAMLLDRMDQYIQSVSTERAQEQGPNNRKGS